MAITYDSGTNTIIVTGDNAGVPWTFEDIYQEDVNQGWGKVTKPATNIYIFEAKLQIGDGTTVTSFKDTSKTVIFRNVATAAGEIIIHVKNNASFQLGTLYDSTLWRVKDGCTIIFEDNYNQLRLYGDSNASIKLYGFTFYNSTNRNTRVSLSGHIEEIINSYIYGTLNAGNTTKVRYLYLVHNTAEISGFQLSSDTEHVYVFTTANCVYASYSNSVYIKNGVLNGEKLANIGESWSGNITIVDCRIGNEIVNWGGTTWSGGKVYIKYTVKVVAKDPDGNVVQGATVIIVDKDGNVVSTGTTNSSGEFEDIILVREHYPDTSVTPFTDISVDYNPFTIIVRKYGYEQFTLRTTINNKLTVSAVLGKTALEFGFIAFVNRFEINEDVILAVDLYMSDGTPVEGATVQVKLIDPQGNTIIDWTTMNDLGNGVYSLNIGKLSKGLYIVKYKASHNGLVVEGADTVQVVDDVTSLKSEIKQNRSLMISTFL